MLTGTPLLNRPAELFTQLSALAPTAFNNWVNYALQFCDGYYNDYGLVAAGASNLNELNNLLNTHCMIRRLKEDVLTELPSKRRSPISLEPSAKEITRYKKHIGRVKHQILLALKETNYSTEKAWAKLRQQHQELMKDIFSAYRYVGEAKKGVAADWLIQALEDNDEKIIVFAHHQNVLDYIEEQLSSNDIKSVRIDGKTPLDQRQSAVEVFQGDSLCRVALLSLTAAGTGLTLTASNKVFMAELYWTPAICLQAEDRCHRIGQKNFVMCWYGVIDNEMDAYMWKMLNKKAGVISEAVDAENKEFSDAIESSYSMWGMIRNMLEGLNRPSSSNEDYIEKKQER